jgi:hypothetical protein
MFIGLGLGVSSTPHKGGGANGITLGGRFLTLGNQILTVGAR